MEGEVLRANRCAVLIDFVMIAPKSLRRVLLSVLHNFLSGNETPIFGRSIPILGAKLKRG